MALCRLRLLHDRRLGFINVCRRHEKETFGIIDMIVQGDEPLRYAIIRTASADSILFRMYSYQVHQGAAVLLCSSIY